MEHGVHATVRGLSTRAGDLTQPLTISHMDQTLAPAREHTAPVDRHRHGPERRWDAGPSLTLLPDEDLTPMPRTLVGMRLAIVTDTFAPQLNGVARTLGRLSETAVAQGADVMVYTTTDPGAAEDTHIHRFQSVPFWAYPELRLGYPGARAMEAALRLWRPTLVHVATPFGLGLAARSAAARLDVPLVSSYHTSLASYAGHYGLGALARSGWHFLRWFHNGAARTYCPTTVVKDELARRGFRNTTLWPRGVDAAKFHPARRSHALRQAFGVADHEVLVGYVGRIAREKGIDDLLSAYTMLQQKQPDRVRLMLVGDGPYLAECRRRAPDGTIFAGRREGSELPEFFASLDLFVFPSVTDTFGNVLLESMASGVPVIAAECATSREVLSANAAAWYAPNDFDALAARIGALAGDAGRRTTLGDRGREVARRRSWPRVMDDLFRDYLLVSGAGLGWPDHRPAA